MLLSMPPAVTATFDISNALPLIVFIVVLLIEKGECLMKEFGARGRGQGLSGGMYRSAAERMWGRD